MEQESNKHGWKRATPKTWARMNVEEKDGGQSPAGNGFDLTVP